MELLFSNSFYCDSSGKMWVIALYSINIEAHRQNCGHSSYQGINNKFSYTDRKNQNMPITGNPWQIGLWHKGRCLVAVMWKTKPFSYCIYFGLVFRPRSPKFQHRWNLVGSVVARNTLVGSIWTESHALVAPGQTKTSCIASKISLEHSG